MMLMVRCLACGYTNEVFFLYIEGAIARSGAYFGKGWGKPIWLDNVNCGSGEYKLINCPKNCIGCHNCNHNEDAGAECPGNKDRVLYCSCFTCTMVT